jgi:cytochrome c5
VDAAHKQGNRIMKGTLFLTLFAATSQLACGKHEEASAPAPLPAAIPQTGSASEPVVPAANAAIAKSGLAHGQQIYRQSCAFCHDKGLMGAPQIGDAAAWSPRLAQGMDALYASALRGKGAMPAKGGNPSLPGDDVKAAVNFIRAQVH